MEWLGIDLRRLGNGLLAFGIVGVLIAGLVAVGLIAGALAARNLDERLAAEQARIVAALDKVDATIAKTVTTIDNAGTTLSTTATTVSSAGDVIGGVASTSEALSTSLDFTILGNQPLAGAAKRFGELAVQARGFEEKAAALATNLQTNASDASGLADEIESLRGQLTSLQEQVASFEATGGIVDLLIGGILLVALLVAWLAVAGAACAWVGLRLRRMGAVAVATADSTGARPSV